MALGDEAPDKDIASTQHLTRPQSTSLRCSNTQSFTLTMNSAGVHLTLQVQRRFISSKNTYLTNSYGTTAIVIDYILSDIVCCNNRDP